MKKLNMEVKEKYQVEISNRFVALESLVESFDINSAWESIRENIKTSAKDNVVYQKLRHNKPWFGAHPASYPMGTRGSFPGVKRPGCEAYHSPPSSAEVKNVWIYTFTPLISLHGVLLS
jgi:hypothetical protein